MSRDNTVRVRLSDIELQALKQYAESIGVPMAEVLRDYVKTLIGNFRGIEPHQLPKAPSRR
jgi:predicted DNA binding CopG/RHH family protein